MAIAFSAAPGTIGPDEPGPYGAYASALAEMIGAGGLGLDDIFARVRLRVAEQTQGGQIPWFVSQLDVPFYMTERDASAPPPPNVLAYADIRSKPLRDFGNVEDAYAAALELDTFEGYEQFLAAYPTSSYARRIAAMLAVRREEIIWRRCIADDTPQAYWSYLRRYPNGPHVWDARRRLAILRAELAPPPSFAFVDFGVPPPPPDELIVVDRPVVLFFAPGLPPPPRPPIFFLPPRPREFVALAAPPPPRERFGLPVPRIAVVPASVKPPANVRPPAGQPGAPPGGGQRVPISLPGAVAHPGAPRASGPPSGQHLPPAGQPIVPPPHQGGPPQPPAASLKPAPIPPHALPPPPPHGAPPPPLAPAAVKPAPPPPHPVPPPPPHAAPPPHPAPAAVKPPPPPHPAPPPPPHPALPPPHPAPAAAKPPPPPPHPAPTAAASGCRQATGTIQRASIRRPRAANRSGLIQALRAATRRAARVGSRAPRRDNDCAMTAAYSDVGRCRPCMAVLVNGIGAMCAMGLWTAVSVRMTIDEVMRRGGRPFPPGEP